MFGFFGLRPVAATSVLILLVACATPQQQCIARETAEYRSVSAQITSLEETLARGYALHRQSVPIVETRTCQTKDGQLYPCQRTRLHMIETPVAVDLKDIRTKLKRLRAQQAKMAPSVASATAACKLAYPE